ncbi:MAG: DUF4440 domain-containing protein [Acidobacteriota bacterium]
MRVVIVAAALILLLPGVPRQAPADGSLRSLVEAEREFAESARRQGLRDSFLAFFADDAIALTPAAEPAKDRLRARPARPFAELEITWEPRQGDVAASGDLGWLTGPSTIIDHTAAPAEPQFGNYLSVWRRQPDGRWRVYIDVGVQTPTLPAFAPGFVRSPESRYTGPGGTAAATRTLADADRLLNQRIASQRAAAAFLAVALESSRLHRPEASPSVGRQAIKEWLSAHAAGMSAVATAAEASRSGDLGYSYGTYTQGGAGREAGAYVRIWTRDVQARWRLMVDVAQPVR